MATSFAKPQKRGELPILKNFNQKLKRSTNPKTILSRDDERF